MGISSVPKVCKHYMVVKVLRKERFMNGYYSQKKVASSFPILLNDSFLTKKDKDCCTCLVVSTEICKTYSRSSELQEPEK